MKTPEAEIKTRNEKPNELTEEEAEQISGGIVKPRRTQYWFGIPETSNE